MLEQILSAFGFKNEPPLGPAPGVRSVPRTIEVGDILHAYVPRRHIPNAPGPVATPCVVLGRDVSQGRPVLLVSPLKALPKGASTPSTREVDLVGASTLKHAGINRPARIDATDQRILPLDPAFFAAGSYIGAIGRLDDISFNQMRNAYRIARQIQAMRQESREINRRAGYGRIRPRNMANVENTL